MNKDIHAPRPATGAIPVISPMLHIISMTGVVFLRSQFGWAYFSPKAIFFAFTWVVIFLDRAAWDYPEVWSRYRAVCIFATIAAVLYWLHVLTTHTLYLRKRGKHDAYSGRSHFLPLAELLGIKRESAELFLHMWIEPAFIAFTGFALRLVFSETHVSTWLFIVAVALAIGEYLNFWLGVIRREKTVSDINMEIENQTENLVGENVAPSTPKATRTEPVKIKRKPQD